MSDETRVSRREFLLASAAVTGGFALGWSAPARAASSPASQPGQAGSAIADKAAAITDWVRITSDDVVTIVVSQAEMGQGIATTLPAILCDELGAEWPRVRFELAPTAAPYRNPRNQWQFTGNSESTQSFAQHMREVGATAREMLAAAAAQRWNVAPGECEAKAQRVTHRRTARSFTFGELAVDAAAIAPPKAPRLRPDRELHLVGRSLDRVDVPSKVDGSAQFGIDYIPEGLEDVAFAAVRTAPAYGARPTAIRNQAEIERRSGVVAVVTLPNAVAVVARRYWQARAALRDLDVVFDAGPHAKLSSEALQALYRDKLENGPFVVAHEEKGAGARGAHAHFEATYSQPFQSHATLEPMNALARVTASGVDVWAPTQGQELTKFAVAQAAGVDPSSVRICRSPFLGGGFGRRLLPDFCIDAVLLSKATGLPVKAIWSREEDIRRDWYRPATLHRLRADVDARGFPSGIAIRVVSPTILKPVYPPLDLSKGLDPSAMEGTLHTRYRIPRWRSEMHLLEIPVPTSVYRTTGYGPSVFAVESFMDELARRAKADPYRYRRALLAHDARAVRVLDTAARKANWGQPAAHGRGRGMAFTDAFGTLLAQVVEVSVKGDAVHVERIVTAADPGRVYDPRIAESAIEGGAVWGITAIAKDEITFKDGGPEQTNFHQYDMVRLRETPRFETTLLESRGATIGGMGEVGPVATAPALANAIFDATGKRVRASPLSRDGLHLA